MTYLQFHAWFNAPLTLLLIVGNAIYGGSMIGPELVALVGVLVVVFLFTSPWDNWAVREGIWDFPPERVWRRLHYLPVEEYLFFAWQTLNVILLTRLLLELMPSWRSGAETSLTMVHGIVCGLILTGWAGLGFLRKWRAAQRRQRYAWHLLFWFLPIVFFQWAFAPSLWQALGLTVFSVTLMMGTYYTLADLVAVRAGVWFFDEQQITGFKLMGILPWEEIAFFYLTSLLVVQTYLLLLPAALR
jgi:lycopene beta-cyclase